MPLGGGDKGVIMSEIIVDIDEARCDLAAIFRWTARESMHEGIANHFSYAVSDDGQREIYLRPARGFISPRHHGAGDFF